MFCNNALHISLHIWQRKFGERSFCGWPLNKHTELLLKTKKLFTCLTKCFENRFVFFMLTP